MALTIPNAMTEYRIRFGYYEPYEKQRLFHALGAQAAERFFSGGNGTGKTYCGALEPCMHLTGVYPSWWEGRRFRRPVAFWALGESSELVRGTLQKYYLGDDYGGLGGIHPSLIIKKTYKPGVPDAVDMVYVKHACGGVSTLQFKTYEQGRRKIQSAALDGVHCDEEPPEPIYNELRMRLMRRENSMLIITATPLQGMTKLLLTFLESEGERVIPGRVISGRAYVTASWDDNPYLPVEEKERMRQTMTEHERQAREHGIPWTGAGLVIPVDLQRYTIPPFQPPRWWRHAFSMDFGWNPSPTHALFQALNPDTGELTFYREYRAYELTPQKVAYHLLTHYQADKIPGCGDKACKITSVNDGSDLLSLYSEAGIHLTPADNRKELGYQTVLELFQNDLIKITEDCKHLLSELRTLSRNEHGVIQKGNDHAADCLRYGVMTGRWIGKPLELTEDEKKYRNYQSTSTQNWMAH